MANFGPKSAFFLQKIWQLTESGQDHFIERVICFVNMENNWFATTFEWKFAPENKFTQFCFLASSFPIHSVISIKRSNHSYAKLWSERMFSISARPYFLIKLVSQEMMTIRAQGGRIIVIWKHLMKIQELLTNLKVSLTILLVRGSYTVRLPVNLWLLRRFIWIPT